MRKLKKDNIVFAYVVLSSKSEKEQKKSGKAYAIGRVHVPLNSETGSVDQSSKNKSRKHKTLTVAIELFLRNYMSDLDLPNPQTNSFFFPSFLQDVFN